MNGPAEDDLPPELLAAYADGELPPDLAERVARWIATDPEALGLADEQASLSPVNEPLRDDLEIPMPSARQWAGCLAGVRGELEKTRRQWNLRPYLAGLAMAAAVMLAVFAGARNHFHAFNFVLPPEASDDDMVVMASHDDIEILSISEADVPYLLVGRHPLNEDLVLARSHELEFIGVGSDAEGRFPDVPTDPLTEESPLLWTPAPP